MDDFLSRAGENTNGHGQPNHDSDDWAELLARTVAHLAAQLTMTQMRLRAMASELADRDILARNNVQSRLSLIANAETGTYLRENLGEALTELIDVDALQSEIVAFLDAESGDD